MRTFCTLLSGLIVTFVVNSAVAQGMPKSVHNQIDSNLIGDWGFTSSYDGETSRGTLSVRWAPGNHAAIAVQESKTAEDEQHNVSLLGWESDKKAVVQHGFVSTGNHWTLRWTELGEATWKGTMTGAQDGQPYESPATVNWKENSFELTAEMGGKPLVFEAVRMKAVSPESEDR